ncbi:MAG TPA: hypothetical protein VL996_05860 [Methylocella sp.]|nr:hypothetical protein [Methylocella sp.]
MDTLVVGSVLFGIFFGRFFKWPILILAYGLVIALVFAISLPFERSLIGFILEIIMLTISLQFGYVMGVLARKLPYSRSKYSGVRSPGIRAARPLRRVEERRHFTRS